MESLENILNSALEGLKREDNGHAPLHGLLAELRKSNQAAWSEDEKVFAYIITIWIGSYNRSLSGYMPPSISDAIFVIRSKLIHESFIPTLNAYINKEISEWDCFVAIKTKYTVALNEYAALLGAKSV